VGTPKRSTSAETEWPLLMAAALLSSGGIHRLLKRRDDSNLHFHRDSRLASSGQSQHSPGMTVSVAAAEGDSEGLPSLDVQLLVNRRYPLVIPADSR
jgi:hypothetical protein